MLANRLILAALLIAAPALCAQQPVASAKSAPALNAVHAGRALRSTFEPLQLTITFRRTREGKTTLEKTYTITASSQQADPQIRDDSRIPAAREKDAPAQCPSATEYYNSNTDVDVQNIRKAGELVSLTLRISQDGLPSSPPAERTVEKTTLSSHRYTISPTVPIGKLVSVYSMSDEVNNYKVEVLLLVQPIEAK